MLAAAAPTERLELSDDELDACLEAIADFCDLRCMFFAGHGRGTADLVEAASGAMGLSTEDARLARRAALVHDVGRFGVPGSMWDKPGPLTASEWERVRMHVYYVERIFSRPEPLAGIGRLAGLHHERLDGSGYHRGVGAAQLSPAARLLAVADAAHAMTQDRPHRPALAEADLIAQLRAEVAAGRLEAAATDAVLAAAGHVKSRPRPSARRRA